MLFSFSLLFSFIFFLRLYWILIFSESFNLISSFKVLISSCLIAYFLFVPWLFRQLCCPFFIGLHRFRRKGARQLSLGEEKKGGKDVESGVVTSLSGHPGIDSLILRDQSAIDRAKVIGSPSIDCTLTPVSRIPAVNRMYSGDQIGSLNWDESVGPQSRFVSQHDSVNGPHSSAQLLGGAMSPFAEVGILTILAYFF